MQARIKAVNEFFKTATLPSECRIGGFKVENVQHFVKSHTLYINNNKPKMVKAYLERLEELKSIIESKN